MEFYYEWGIRQINKRGEELCGDAVVVSRHPDSVVVALSDGLGSGVKANILATLTTQIAIRLLENGLPLTEVVKALGDTLPVCQVRKLAYSTFALAQLSRQGAARVVEFDSPPAIWLRGRKAQEGVYGERCIESKVVRESVFDVAVGDWIVFISDGVVNAGIGGAYPLGWGSDQAKRYLEKHAHPQLSAQDLADRMAETVGELYAGPPGDDVSIIVVKVRRKLVINVLTGPPLNRAEDEAVVGRFLKRGGCLAVCGGTTAKMVARYLGQPVEVDLGTAKPDVPPMGRIKGLDLVTEGILTLTGVADKLRAGVTARCVRFQMDGASALIRAILDADHVHFVVGHAVNPAHQNPDLPNHLGIRLTVVREVADELRKRGLEVTIESV